MTPILVRIVGFAFSALTLVWTVYAFLGDPMPLIGYETSGGIGPGLLWLFIIDPILVGLSFPVAGILFMPLALLEAKIRGVPYENIYE